MSKGLLSSQDCLFKIHHESGSIKPSLWTYKALIISKYCELLTNTFINFRIRKRNLCFFYRINCDIIDHDCYSHAVDTTFLGKHMVFYGLELDWMDIAFCVLTISIQATFFSKI